MRTRSRSSKQSAKLIKLAEDFGAHNYHPLPVVLTRGRGVFVWDVEGNRYFDMLSAYSALNQGHVHPKIAAAAKRQIGRLTLTSRAFHNDLMGPLLQRLCKLAGMDRAILMNSGAEAVETAIKAMRLWGYRRKGIPRGQAEIIVCENNFHGRTTTIVGFSCDPLSTEGFGPATPGFKIIPYGDAEALRTAIGPHTCGFLVEPIQGEAGVNVPPAGYLKAVRAICSEKNVLWAADEIQTGLGRTGRMFAVEHEGVSPDLLILGKALSGGFYPVSAVLSREDVLGLFTPGTHGSTFGGNPLACAIAQASLDVLEKERLAEKAERMGRHFMKGLRELRHPALREIRGRGLLIGVEFGGPVRPLCEALMRRGLLAKDTHEKTLRLAPPLLITKPQIDAALKIIKAAVAAMTAAAALAAFSSGGAFAAVAAAASPDDIISAAKSGDLVAVKRILKEGGELHSATVNARDKAGMTPLMWAAQNGEDEIVELLLESGADPDARGPSGLTALMRAAYNDHPEIAADLIKHGAELEERSVSAATALAFAAGRGSVASLEVLAKAEADLNTGEKDARTPLWLAAQRGDVNVVRALLKAGADLKAPDRYGRSALMSAAAEGHVDVMKLLVKAGADVKARTREGDTALGFAAGQGRVDAVRFLLEMHADPNARLVNGASALMIAAAKGRDDVAGTLLKAGADVKARDRKGATALMYAAGQGRLDVIRTLLKAGSEINAWESGGRGFTALMMAVWDGHRDAVLELLKAGADATFRDREGKTALDLAKSVRAPEIAAALESAARGGLK